MDNNNNKLNYLNVGTGEEISIKKLSELIAKLVDFTGEIIWDQSKPDGTPRKIMDSSRFRKLGWKHNTNIKRGIEKFIKYFIKKNLNY